MSVLHMNVMTLYDKSISDATAVSVMTRVKARVMDRVRVRVRVMIIRGFGYICDCPKNTRVKKTIFCKMLQNLP